MALEHSADDEALVQAQLGRPLRGRWAVATRCHLGVPMVIENHPRMEDGAPFPTLFWLTCPMLAKRVSRLESTGWMAELNEQLSAAGPFKNRLSAAIDAYRARRDRHEPLDGTDPPPGGGPDRVKCVHAHTAHELAAPPNPVGALALSRVAWPDCREPCVRVITE